MVYRRRKNEIFITVYLFVLKALNGMQLRWLCLLFKNAGLYWPQSGP